MRAYQSKLEQYPLSENTERWLVWRADYVRHCTEKKCCDWYEWIEIYTAHLTRENPIMPPFKKIILYGFDQIPPLFLNFFKILESHISVVSFQAQISHQNVLTKLKFNDHATEIKAMLAWVKHELSGGKKRLACVIPNLNEHLPIIRRHMNDLFADDVKTHFSIYENKSLFNVPLIYHALTMLNSLKKDNLF